MKQTLFFLAILFFTTAAVAKPGDPELERKVDRIHRSAITIDSHTDTPLWFDSREYDFGNTNEGLRNRVDLPKMEAGGLDAVFMAVFTGQGKRNEDAFAQAYEEAETIFDGIYTQVGKYPDRAEVARTANDARRIERTGKRAIYIGLENGYPLGKDITKVKHFYDRGARYITLSHTKNNDLCDSSTDKPEHNGLSDFGRDVVHEMNRLGMMVDVSHISDKAFYDVIETSITPVIASHSCARALCDNPRNLTDDMLRALAAHGGVIQMCILSDYVKTPPPFPERDTAYAQLRRQYGDREKLTDAQREEMRRQWRELEVKYPRPLANVQDVVDHIDHMVKVAGIKHVGIGTDFDGGGGVEGCMNVAEMKNITRELVKRGYSARQIKLIWGGNLLRVMKQVEKKRTA